MPEERVAVTVASVSAGVSETHSVVLQDDTGRQMRIYIGPCEAQALTLALSGVPPDRPQTYEALLACVTASGAAVAEACITALINETYHAQVLLTVGETSERVAMRPSDALNLAVRARCPLFVTATIFQAQTPERSDHTASDQGTESLGTAAEEGELARLFTEDQADRRVPPGEQIDWDVIGPRDAARLARVKELCRGGALHQAEDYYHAAMVLQHAHEPEDHLLAHELCVIAVDLGHEPARWLAAASEDRFLMRIGRPQRFGTQFRVDGPDGRWCLSDVDPGVTDAMRVALGVPPLSEAQARAARMNAG